MQYGSIQKSSMHIFFYGKILYFLNKSFVLPRTVHSQPLRHHPPASPVDRKRRVEVEAAGGEAD